MEELGTAVTSANALHKGDQGAHTPSSEIASHGHLHQGPPISLHPEQLPLARAACRLASHPGISHPTLPAPQTLQMEAHPCGRIRPSRQNCSKPPRCISPAGRR